MDRLISLQAAIDALQKIMDKSAKGEIGSFYNTVIVRNIEILESLPPAQPERKGKWIKEEREEWFTDYPYKCTNCEKYSMVRYHFCPNCGADMRCEQEEKK